MAISDKNIIITPHNNGLTAQPEIFFGGSGGVPIRLRVLDDSLGTLSWQGSAGQLFSINNNLTSGSIFSVNDVSGIPSIDVNANGTVSIAGYTGNVGIGLTGPTVKFQVTGGAALFGGGVTFASITDHAGVARFAAGITANTIDITGETRLGGHVIISRGVTIGGGGGVLNPLGGISGVTFTATIDVTGVARFNGGATASVLDVTNAARFNGGATASALNVTNVTRLNGGVTASTLDVSGTSRFAGTASFNDVSLGLCAGVGRFGTIQSTGTGQITVAIPSGILLPGTTQAGLRFLSDDGLGGNFSTTFQTTTLSANRTITLPNESGTVALRDANTFTGLQTLTAGLSAAGGITFNGTITGATATLNRLLTISAGLSAAGGVTFNDIINPVRGVVNGYPRIEWAGLTSTFDIIPSNWANISAPINSSPVANDAYFAPIFITRRVQIKTIGTQTGSNGASNTGNILLGLYDSDSFGFPRDRLYTSGSIALSTSAFAVQRATSVDTIVNPGQYWLAIVFSASSIPVAGLGRVGSLMKWITPTSSSPIGQGSIDGLRRAQGSFTLATSQSGTFTNVTGSDNPALFYTAEAV